MALGQRVIRRIDLHLVEMVGNEALPDAYRGLGLRRPARRYAPGPTGAEGPGAGA